MSVEEVLMVEILASSNRPKNQPNFTDFCLMKPGQKLSNLVGFCGDLKTPKFHSEINGHFKACGICITIIYVFVFSS